MLLGSKCISMHEDGQWRNKIEYVERSWWGLQETRYPMRFAQSPDTDEYIRVWLIQYKGGQWQAFFRYPDE
jgi:hypothetical protein